MRSSLYKSEGATEGATEEPQNSDMAQIEFRQLRIVCTSNSRPGLPSGERADKLHSSTSIHHLKKLPKKPKE